MFYTISNSQYRLHTAHMYCPSSTVQIFNSRKFGQRYITKPQTQHKNLQNACPYDSVKTAHSQGMYVSVVARSVEIFMTVIMCTHDKTLTNRLYLCDRQTVKCFLL